MIRINKKPRPSVDEIKQGLSTFDALFQAELTALNQYLKDLKTKQNEVLGIINTCQDSTERNLLVEQFLESLKLADIIAAQIPRMKFRIEDITDDYQRFEAGEQLLDILQGITTTVFLMSRTAQKKYAERDLEQLQTLQIKAAAFDAKYATTFEKFVVPVIIFLSALLKALSHVTSSSLHRRQSLSPAKEAEALSETRKMMAQPSKILEQFKKALPHEESEATNANEKKNDI